MKGQPKKRRINKIGTLCYIINPEKIIKVGARGLGFRSSLCLLGLAGGVNAHLGTI